MGSSCPSVYEHAQREEERSNAGPMQPRFWLRLAAGRSLNGAMVQLLLMHVDDKGDRCADANAPKRTALLSNVEAVLCKDKPSAVDEEEESRPGGSNPETDGKNDGFGGEIS